MYEVDDRDRVVELTDVPQPDTGAPLPVVLATDHSLVLGYLMRFDTGYEKEPCCILNFQFSSAHYFDNPNDEALHGHPLAGRGLHPYGMFEVLESSWIRTLERMNRAHEYHDPNHFFDKKHFVLTFHDTTFECVAESFSVAIWDGFQPDLPAELARRLR